MKLKSSLRSTETEPVTEILISNNSIYTGHQNGLIKIWNTQNRITNHLKIHSAQILALRKTKELLITHSRNIIKILHSKNYSLILSLQSDNLHFTKSTIKNNLLTFIDNTQKISTFNLKLLKPNNLQFTNSNQNIGVCMAIHQLNNNQLLAAYEDGSLHLLSNNMLDSIVVKAHTEPILDLKLSGKRVYTCAADSTIVVYQLDSNVNVAITTENSLDNNVATTTDDSLDKDVTSLKVLYTVDCQSVVSSIGLTSNGDWILGTWDAQ